MSGHTYSPVGRDLRLAERDVRNDRIRRVGIALALSVAVLLALTGCATSPSTPYLAGALNGSERDYPAPRSTMDKKEALTLAKLWSMGAPGRAFCEVEPTSSMVPTFDSHSVLLLERADAIGKNDIARWTDPVHGNVTHRVKAVLAGGIRTEGDNCEEADRVVAFGQVQYRVAGILYTR